MTQFAIDVTGLMKKFDDKVVVDGVNIQMPYAQVWGFLGPNGSGKTTTIRMLCGLLGISAGQGTCLGYDILKQSKKIKAKTGYMTQKFSFWEDLTIKENLEFVARLYHLPNRKKVVAHTLENLGLAHRQNQLAAALSGGWKQRLALAAVTMHKPDLLLLDEPTAGVDPQARRDFWNEIHRLSSNGMTVLVSTHYMDEAERCDKIVYLANGRLVTQGSVNEIIEQSSLVTFKVQGDGVRRLAAHLECAQGVDYVAYFGSALHVSGQNDELIKQAIIKADTQHDFSWQPVRPTLEDTFIALMQQAGADEREHN